MTESQAAAVLRLVEAAKVPSDQGRVVADFLLAWHNAGENGGFDLTGLWRVAPAIVQDMVTVFGLIATQHAYPDELGFGQDLEMLWRMWRRGSGSQ